LRYSFKELGEFEVDESFCGAKRVRGKRGQRVGMKTIVFWLLKRGGKVYAGAVPNVKAKTLKSIIRKKVSPESEANTDGW